MKVVSIRFLARIFLHLDWIRRDTPYISLFSPNVGKYGPENYEYGHISCSVNYIRKKIPTIDVW